MPKISIIVPAFNAEKEIKKCVESIIRQTFKDWELILLDDGSTDHTFKICSCLAEQDNRIVLLHHDNMGVAATRNRGIEVCKGEWVTFVDSDDWLNEKCLEISYNKACEQGADIVMWNMQDEFPDGRVKKYYPLEGNERVFESENIAYIESLMLTRLSENHKKNQIGVLIGPVCKLIRKSCLNNTYFPKHLCFGEDSCFCFQLIHKCTKLIYINYFFYHRIIRETSLSHYVSDAMWKKRLDYVNWVVDFFESETSDNKKELNYFCYMDYRSLLINYFFSDNSLKYNQKKDAIIEYKKNQKYVIDYSMIKDWYKPVIKYDSFWLLYICGKIKIALFKVYKTIRRRK